MNQIPTLILLGGLTGGPLLAADSTVPVLANAPTNAPALTNVVSAAPAATPEAPAPDVPASAPAAAPDSPPARSVASAEPAAPAAATADPNCLRLNFRGAPLEVVLNSLSEAAGFIIVLETQPRGRVDVWSNQPLTQKEAVELLNSVLNKNGYAAIRRGRTLTICNKDEAKVKSIPVKLGSEPEKIPDNDEMVTQIIPVRYVEVAQLLKDLQPLVSTQTPITANESGNSIVITDTQCNIRRVAEIIKAIDMGAEDVTEVKVFHLQYADPNEMSDLLVNLFPDESRSGGSSAPMQFGGFRRMFGGFGGPPGMGGGSSGNQNQRIKKRARVIAVPDPRTASVVVTAAKDLMYQIEAVVSELDANPARKQTVQVFQLDNAEPQEAMQVLQDIFQKNTSVNNRNQNYQNSALQNRNNQQNQQYGSGNRNNRSSGMRRNSSIRR